MGSRVVVMYITTIVIPLLEQSPVLLSPSSLSHLRRRLEPYVVLRVLSQHLDEALCCLVVCWCWFSSKNGTNISTRFAAAVSL